LAGAAQITLGVGVPALTLPALTRRLRRSYPPHGQVGENPTLSRNRERRLGVSRKTVAGTDSIMSVEECGPESGVSLPLPRTGREEEQ